MCWLDDPVTPERVDVPNEFIALIYTQGWPMERSPSGGYHAEAWVIAVARTAVWALDTHTFNDVKAFCGVVRDVKTHAFIRAVAVKQPAHSALFEAILNHTNTRDMPA